MQIDSLEVQMQLFYSDSFYCLLYIIQVFWSKRSKWDLPEIDRSISFPSIIHVIQFKKLV